MTVWALALAACGSGSGELDGLVLERQREIAVEGALVRVESLEETADVQITFTDINGLYHFDSVPEGVNRVTVIREGYLTSPEVASCQPIGSCRVADVVEGGSLTLDFFINLIVRNARRDLVVRITDDRGPLAGATVDLWEGPCIGRTNTRCNTSLNDLPGPLQNLYTFTNSQRTDASGTVRFEAVGQLTGNAILEFTEYLFQLRITAPQHQNRVFDLSVTLDGFPSQVDVVLPRL